MRLTEALFRSVSASTDPDMLRWLYHHPQATTETQCLCVENRHCPDDVIQAAFAHPNPSVRYSALESPAAQQDTPARHAAIASEQHWPVLSGVLSWSNQFDDEALMVNPLMSDKLLVDLQEPAEVLVSTWPKTFWAHAESLWGQVPDEVAADRMCDPDCTPAQRDVLLSTVCVVVVDACVTSLRRLLADHQLSVTDAVIAAQSDELDHILAAGGDPDVMSAALVSLPLSGFILDPTYRRICELLADSASLGPLADNAGLIVAAVAIADRITQAHQDLKGTGRMAARWLLNHDPGVFEFAHRRLARSVDAELGALLGEAVNMGRFVQAGHIVVRSLVYRMTVSKSELADAAGEHVVQVYRSWMRWAVEQHVGQTNDRPFDIEIMAVHQLLGWSHPAVRETWMEVVAVGGVDLLNAMYSFHERPPGNTRGLWVAASPTWDRQDLRSECVHVLGSDAPLDWLLRVSPFGPQLVWELFRVLPDGVASAAEILSDGWHGTCNELMNAARLLVAES